MQITFKQLLLCIVLSIQLVGFSQVDSTATPKQLQFDERQVTPLSFDKESLQELKNDEAFNYVDVAKTENWWQRFKNWLNNIYHDILHWLFGDYEANTFIAFLVEILPYIALALLIGLIIWLFIRLSAGGRLLENSQAAEVFMSEDEEIINTKDIPQLIQEALATQDYRLAVRYYYLLMLKKLSDKNIIDYEFQKTNADYLKEIKTQTLSTLFKRLTRIYDFTWYGDFKVTQTEFSLAERQFKSLEQEL